MNDVKNKEVFSKYVAVIERDKIPAGEMACKKMDLNLEDLSCIVFYLNDFMEMFSESSMTRSHTLAKLCELIVGFGTVSIVDDLEREYHENDFPCTAQYAVTCFKLCGTLLKRFEDLDSSDKHQIIINMLLLSATHHKKCIWSSEASVNSSSEFLKSLLLFTNHQTLSDLLCDENFYPTIFKGTLKKMRPSLMKDTWLKNPSICYVFAWILHHVKHPYLADYLEDVFPPPCMFASDYQPKHRILAIQCFEHILDNVPPTMLKLDGKEEVIYSLLSPHMHSTDEDVFAILPTCLLKLPSMKSQNFQRSHISWSKYDEALNRLLVNAESEFNMDIKNLCLSHIHSFIQIVPPFKHLKRLLKVIEDCIIKEEDVLCQMTALVILKDVIKFCWPRMEKHCFLILKSLTILLLNLEDGEHQANNEEKKKLYDLCKECLCFLKWSCKEKFEEILSKFIEDSEMPAVELFQSVLQEK